MKKVFLYVGVIFFIGITLVVFENDSYSVTKVAPKRAGGITAQKQKKNYSQTNKNPSVNRSAVNKRAASSNSAAPKGAVRAATTRSATAARANSVKTARIGRRTPGKTVTNDTPATPAPAVVEVTETKTVSTNTYCPVMTVLKQTNGDNGTSVFYSARDKTCDAPENATVVAYSTANKSSLPLKMQSRPSWIALNNACYFECNSGYIARSINNVNTCVSIAEICPLNTIIEKTNDGLRHPNTQENCYAAENSIMMTKNEIEESEVKKYSFDIAPDDMRMFVCRENQYADNSSVSYTDNLFIECKNCPTGKYSQKGSKGLQSCQLPCETGFTNVFENGDYTCRACNTQCATYNSTTKSCNTKEGWICKDNGTGLAVPADLSVCDSNVSVIEQDENGNNICKCNDGYVGNGIKTELGGEGCVSECSEHATRTDGTCVCNEGYVGDGRTCEEAPTGLTANDCVENATFENGKCKCPDGHFGDGLKDNDKSPLCKYLPTSSLCTTEYNSETKQGTEIPRGCIPVCATGEGWMPVDLTGGN